jgi:DNA-binding response OmpR family regulator
MNKNILLVEDDENLGIVLTDYLSMKGYKVTLAKNGEEGFQKYSQTKYDLLILDIMMPKLDGFSLAKKIRLNDKSTPIIFLTAKSMIEDRVEGLKIGADDYLTKPFSTEELLLRMKNVLKRVENSNLHFEDNRTEYIIGDFRFDYNKRVLASKNSEIKLTSKEAELLKLLCINRNQLLDRTAALKHIWKDDNYFTSRSMDVYISKLRRYLKDDSKIEIVNLHGSGFKLICPD